MIVLKSTDFARINLIVWPKQRNAKHVTARNDLTVLSLKLTKIVNNLQ